MMDHVSARVAKFNVDGMMKIAKRFGFYGIRHGGRSHMYMHGLATTPGTQEREQILNSAVFFSLDRSPDDPWGALKRLLRREHPRIAFNRFFDVEGATVFKNACALGGEGIVLKRLGSPYRSGRTDFWVKTKNPSAPAVKREAEEDWVR